MDRLHTGASKRQGRPSAQRKRETGIRLHEDQIEKLDMIVTLSKGREDRSRLIREGIDYVIEQRLGNAVKGMAEAHRSANS